MIPSKDVISICNWIKFELTLMKEVRTPPSALEKLTAEFLVLASGTGFVGAHLGTVQT